MVIDFILQKQGNSLQAALEEWKEESDGNCVGDYSFQWQLQISMRIQKKK